MKKTLNKWQWWFNPININQSWAYRDGQGWHIFSAGIIKIHTLPGEGEAIGKSDYKGFIIRFCYWFPIDKAF